MSFFHASKAFDTWHSYVRRRNVHGLAENNILGCELIGNLSTSLCFAINNEKLLSRIRFLLFLTFLLIIRMKKSDYSNHKLHHFERDCSYTRHGIWDSKLSWNMDDNMAWKVHDALTEERQGAATQANSRGNAEPCRQQLFSKDMEMHHWISSWRWIKNTSMSWKRVI